MSACTAIVIGGGPAGLVAANHLLDAGLSVTLLEARSGLGGRAASHVVGGFVLNEGPHALYLGGFAHKELRRLGIPLAGALPRAFDPRLVRDGRPRRVPVRAVTRFAARVAGTRPGAVAGVSALEWLGDDPSGRAPLHVATVNGALGRLKAGAAAAAARPAAPHGHFPP